MILWRNPTNFLQRPALKIQWTPLGCWGSLCLKKETEPKLKSSRCHHHFSIQPAKSACVWAHRSSHTGSSVLLPYPHQYLKYHLLPLRRPGGPDRESWDSASELACSSALLFKDRHYKNVVCWLKQFVCLISQSSVRSFCHLPCVFCIFQRIASFQQHPLSSHWKWKHVLCRNFPLSRSNFPHWGLSTPVCNAVFLSTAVWCFLSQHNELYSVILSPPPSFYIFFFNNAYFRAISETEQSLLSNIKFN